MSMASHFPLLSLRLTSFAYHDGSRWITMDHDLSRMTRIGQSMTRKYSEPIVRKREQPPPRCRQPQVTYADGTCGKRRKVEDGNQIPEGRKRIKSSAPAVIDLSDDDTDERNRNLAPDSQPVKEFMNRIETELKRLNTKHQRVASVELVNEQDRIFTFAGFRFCYSGQVVAQLLQLPNSGPSFISLMKKEFSSSVLDRHFINKSNRFRYVINNFKGAGFTVKENEAALQVMRRVTVHMKAKILATERESATKASVIAAICYAKNKPVKYPEYMSDILHKHLKGRTIGNMWHLLTTVMKFPGQIRYACNLHGPQLNEPADVDVDGERPQANVSSASASQDKLQQSQVNAATNSSQNLFSAFPEGLELKQLLQLSEKLSHQDKESKRRVRIEQELQERLNHLKQEALFQIELKKLQNAWQKNSNEMTSEQNLYAQRLSLAITKLRKKREKWPEYSADGWPLSTLT